MQLAGLIAGVDVAGGGAVEDLADPLLDQALEGSLLAAEARDRWVLLLVAGPRHGQLIFDLL